MATDVVMPQMGESIAEGTIVRWIKKVGDKVDRDEPLFEISTDKVDAEIPSPAAGVVTEIRVKEGETVPVNSVVAVIGAAAASSAAAALEQRRPRQAAAPEPPAAVGEAGGAADKAHADQPRRREHARLRPLRLLRARRRSRRRGGDSTEERHPPAFVAARAQDRQGTQRRHLADCRAAASPAG